MLTLSLAVALLVILVVILLAMTIYTYTDYRRHREPLVQADPNAIQTYTYGHHINAVTIPLLQYRLHISLNKNSSNSNIKKF